MSAGLRVLIQPKGPWFNIDDSATYDDFQQELLGALVQAGLGTGLTAPEGMQRLGALGLMTPAVAADAAPLQASLLVYRSLAAVEMPDAEVERAADGTVLIRPDRRVWISEQRLASGEDPFQVMHVRYAIPAPDGTLVVLAFASPCLPERELLEWLFDEMVGGLRFVGDEVPDAGSLPASHPDPAVP
jgi:hypothetical protein